MLPAKWLTDFDYDANPAVSAAVINTLATCDWVRNGQLLCLIGDSGTGKSHLLIALGTAAAMAGFRVRYTLASKLANELAEAADVKQLWRRCCNSSANGWPPTRSAWPSR